MADKPKKTQETTEVSHGSGAQEDLFPPLDPATFAPQLIWLAISFVALYIIMSRVALPRIATVIEERRDRVASDLDQAEQLKQQTDEAVAAYEQALAEARARAHGLAQETRETLSQEVEAEKAEVEKQIADKMAEAEKAIADAKSSAIGNLSDVATDVAQSVVTELIGGKLTKAETSKAVSKALAN